MSNLIVDIWQDLDFATLSEANLNAHDHYGVDLWSVAANVHGSMSNSGEKLLEGSINTSLNDGSGSHGFSIDCNFIGGGSYVSCILISVGGPGQQNQVSVGFWLQMPVGWDNSFSEQDVIRFENFVADRFVYVKASDANDVDATTKLHIYSTGVGYVYPGVTIIAGNWYWVTVIYDGSSEQADGGKMRVYDIDGNQVGVEQVTPTSANGCIAISFGPFVGATAAFTGNMYLDDLLIDWTNHSFPLGPGSSPSLPPSDRHWNALSSLSGMTGGGSIGGL